MGFRGLGLRPLIILAAGLLLLGAGLEIAQSFMPGRVTSLNDVFANTIGIVLGSLAAAGIDRVWPDHRPTGR